MQISELLATLHHELIKSYNFIAETKGSGSTSVLHIGIERVEIELPVMLSKQKITYNPQKVKGMPSAFKKLTVPFAPQKIRLPKNPVTGMTVMADIVGHVEKIDERVSAESIGRIKIIFKPIIS